MSARAWLLTLAASAMASMAVAFAGSTIPSCFAPAGGSISAECMAQWEARWSIPERLVHAYGAPLMAVAVFLLFVAVAGSVHVLLRRRQRQG